MKTMILFFHISIESALINFYENSMFFKGRFLNQFQSIKRESLRERPSFEYIGVETLHTYISQIKGIIRYRLLHIDGKYYLVDLEENPLFYFFPFLTWFHKYTLYELNEEQAQRILDNQYQRQSGTAIFSIIYPLSVGTSLILGKAFVSSGLAQIPFFQSKFIQILFLLLTVLACVYFWGHLHKKAILKMEEIVPLRSLDRYYARFIPEEKRSYFSSIFIALVAALFIFVGVSLVIIENLLLGFATFCFFIFFYPISFRGFLHPEKVYKSIFYK